MSQCKFHLQLFSRNDVLKRMLQLLMMSNFIQPSVLSGRWLILNAWMCTLDSIPWSSSVDTKQPTYMFFRHSSKLISLLIFGKVWLKSYYLISGLITSSTTIINPLKNFNVFLLCPIMHNSYKKNHNLSLKTRNMLISKAGQRRHLELSNNIL